MTGRAQPLTSLPTLTENRPLTIFFLTVLASSGLVYVNFLPVIIDALEVGLHYKAVEAGLVGSANIYGGATGSLLAALFNRRLSWRAASMAGLALLAGLDLVTVFVPDFALLLGLRFVHGVVGGVVVGAGFIVISRTAAPDRAFGVMLMLQFAQSGLALYLLPQFTDAYGVAPVFVVMAAMSVATLILVLFLPSYPAPSSATATQAARFGPLAKSPMMLGALLALFLCQVSRFSVTGYVIGLGLHFRLTPAFVSSSLGVTTWIACLGALAPVAFGTRFGRLAPLIGTAAVGVACTLALIWWGEVPAAFWLANAVGGIAGLMGLPYYFGLCSALDWTGRNATWTGFFSKIGLATGPTVGGLVLQENHYMRLLWLSMAIGLCSVTLASWPAHRLDRAELTARGGGAT